MMAVTIGIGPRWRALAELAAETVREQTGLPTRILGEEDLRNASVEKPHHLKFRLFDLLPEADALLYFDADTIFLRPWDPRALLDGSYWIAVADRASHESVTQDAEQIGMPVGEYFNSGLFIANREHHAALLHKALYYEGHFRSIFHDQTALNAARHRARIPLRLLPREYNWLDFDRAPGQPEPIVGHFWKIDQMPADEAEGYFRRWRKQGGGQRIAPRLSGKRKSVKIAAAVTPSLSADELHHYNLAYQVAGSPTAYAPRRHAGRGIVICGGGEKYFPCAWVCIRMLRALGCELPIELWHLGPAEMRPDMRALVEPLGVTCVDAESVRARHPVRRLGGWELKAYAIAHSRFAEVLLIDADNVAVRDPAFLFDEPEYREKGAIFWPDFNRLGPERPIWRVLGIPYRDEPEVESGQLLIDKAKCWPALQFALHLNEHSDFYYRYVLGDKETFHLAWRKLGLDYAMPSRGVFALPATMCQHDLQGRRLFQHRNFAKWQLNGPNRNIPGFQHEERCLGFLDELRARWQPSAGAPQLVKVAGRSAMPTLETVVVNWRRPANIRPLLTALRAQAVASRITLIDVHDDPRNALGEDVLAMADEVFRWRTNHGGFNRFVPALAFSAEYTLFLDDDLVPGARCIEHMLAHARAIEEGTAPGERADGQPRTGDGFGALGQLGRRLRNGRYCSHDVPRSDGLREVDCLVRGYLVPTRHLALLAPLRWEQPQLFYPGMGEDDLVLALALRRAGLPLYVTPLDPDPATRMDAENLPEPDALSHRPDHLVRRDRFVQRHFAGAAHQSVEEPMMAGIV